MYTYIRELIEEDRVYIFYKTEEWIKLRNEVMQELHNECQMCSGRGRLTKADCVHHVNEVRERPELALSKYYIDREGNEQRNLLPLCNTCHNEVHDKLGRWQKKDKFFNKERW